MQDERLPNALRFVVVQEEGAWVAVCLERYIGAQGRTLEEAHQRLKIVYRSTLDDTVDRTGEPFGHIPPAPAEYHDLYETSDPRLRGTIFDGYGDHSEQRLAA